VTDLGMQLADTWIGAF